MILDANIFLHSASGQECVLWHDLPLEHTGQLFTSRVLRGRTVHDCLIANSEKRAQEKELVDIKCFSREDGERILKIMGSLTV